jgi:hypothetical protein
MMFEDKMRYIDLVNSLRKNYPKEFRQSEVIKRAKNGGILDDDYYDQDYRIQKYEWDQLYRNIQNVTEEEYEERIKMIRRLSSFNPDPRYGWERLASYLIMELQDTPRKQERRIANIRARLKRLNLTDNERKLLDQLLGNGQRLLK